MTKTVQTVLFVHGVAIDFCANRLTESVHTAQYDSAWLLPRTSEGIITTE